MAKSMKDNKAVRMLKAAEEGGYGVIGVVSVNLSPSYSYPSILR
jgi:fructose-bisphosphate aldolase class II